MKDHSLKIICSSVIAAHLIGILACLIFDGSKPLKNSSMPAFKQFAVQTVTLSPNKTAEIAPLARDKSIPLKEVDLSRELQVEEERIKKLPKDIEPQETSEVKSAQDMPPVSENLNIEAKKTSIEPPLSPTTLKKLEPKKEIKPIPQAQKNPVVQKSIPAKPVLPKDEPKKKPPLKDDKRQVPVKKQETKTAKNEKSDLELKQKKDLELQKKKNAEIQKKLDADLLAEKIRQQKLFSEVQERIAKIDDSRHNIAPRGSESEKLLTPPAVIMNMAIDAIPANPKAPPLSPKEISYRGELVGRLKLLLRLPEYGNVKIKLTINRAGKVVSLVIVSTESQLNRKYIEKTLPDIALPAFGSNFESDSQYTFLITLSNE